MVTVWCGNYRFKRDDQFFLGVVKAGRDYADREPGQRPTETAFRAEMDRLRDMAPDGGVVLLDQLEHRWKHPDCPPALYVLTCTLLAPEGGFVLDTAGTRRQKALCTKVGRAKRTVAARIERYTWDRLGGLRPQADSHTLRVVIYGDASTMLLERDVQAVARNNGSRAMAIERNGARRRVGSETYAGVAMVDAICAFAQRQAKQFQS
jgi:hypothetical protein